MAAEVRALERAIFQQGTLKKKKTAPPNIRQKKITNARTSQTNFNVSDVSLTVGVGGGMQKSGTSGEYLRAWPAGRRDRTFTDSFESLAGLPENDIRPNRSPFVSRGIQLGIRGSFIYLAKVDDRAPHGCCRITRDATKIYFSGLKPRLFANDISKHIYLR